MYHHIVLANQGSVDAQGALEPALALAGAFDARLTMLVVERRQPAFPLFLSEVDDALAALDAKSGFIIAHAQLRATRAGIALQTHRLVGSLAACTLRFLATTPADLLVLGRADRNVFTFCFGATERLIRDARCPLHIVGQS